MSEKALLNVLFRSPRVSLSLGSKLENDDVHFAWLGVRRIFPFNILW